MSHYEVEDIKKYINHSLSDDLSSKIEEHLEECDDCLNIYLFLIEKNETEEIVPPDFADNVMKEIGREQRVKKRRRMTDVLIYYTAAAAVTLFFVSSGMFQPSAAKTSKVNSLIGKSSISIERIFMNGWSKRIVNSTSNIVNNIKNPGRNINE